MLVNTTKSSAQVENEPPLHEQIHLSAASSADNGGDIWSAIYKQTHKRRKVIVTGSPEVLDEVKVK